jgi:D-cysteine desulfhydrase
MMGKYVTPIMRTHERDNNIYIKRDDLLPFVFGGNKVRIAQEFIADMKQSRKDTMIGYGNSRSNMCRALAVLCSMEHIPCHIISSGDDDGSYQDTWNELIIKNTGAIIHKCRKMEVAQTVERVCRDIIDSGHKPYYIFGDKFGKGNETTPLKAYDSVYKEIYEQTPKVLGGGVQVRLHFSSNGNWNDTIRIDCREV